MAVDTPYDEGSESIVRSEHISPIKSGDNIEAKRVAEYQWNSTTLRWQRATAPLVAGVSYDFIDVQQTSAIIDTFVYKLGGSGGSTVRTIIVTYVDSTKANIDTVAYS